MRTDEVIVARLKGGIGLARFLGDAPAVAGRRRQVRVSIGRNREARLPEDRVVFATGVIATGEDDIERCRSPMWRSCTGAPRRRASSLRLCCFT